MSNAGHIHPSTHRTTRPIRAPDLQNDDDIPELKAHFFYSSPLSIDDPLSAIPSPVAFDGKPTRHPPRPFSPYDNIALEKVWLNFADRSCKRHRKQTSRKSSTSHRNVSSSDPIGTDSTSGGESPGNTITSKTSTGRFGEQAEPREDLDGSPKETQELETPWFKTDKTLRTEQGDEARNNNSYIFDGSAGSAEQGTIRSLNQNPPYSKNINPSSGLQINEAGTTGLPFLRAPSRTSVPLSTSLSSHTADEYEDQSAAGYQRDLNNKQDSSTSPSSVWPEMVAADVPVGVSRLHHVELPSLIMKPIYWSPVHDIATVTRGTWFYKDILFPVEPAVANQLEIGYRELRPWSQTWRDELNSAMEVGAAGEEKVAHRLWPRDTDNMTTATLSTDPSCAASCFHGEAAAEGKIEVENLDKNIQDNAHSRRRYAECQVIYRDFKNAFILKPSLQPSAYYGRKPLQKIKKGLPVGIHVVRGLDWTSWEKLYPPKRTTAAAKLNTGIDSFIGEPTLQPCGREDRPKVTDLILVIHGIGQKLSERVESFHFTHAINSFRRSVNLELSNEGVRRVLRKDLGGVMILPVNWRSNLSFEDGGPMKRDDKERASSHFSLKDITVDTIPAVRNIISDVMLDIPFYMSHHKPKMIQAVISEANRVYRLWCKNNPRFHQEGRVHIIAHSLGSAMALEVLSKQPTFVPRIDLEGTEINRDYFDFSTTNLFFAGSPAGFFLLLDRGKLLPRRGRKKPGAEPGDDTDGNIVGDEGTFGCLAVDNIYNIMHCNDPIAYRLNATVDPVYAATLKNAYVPSAKAGFFGTIGNAMRSLTPGAASATEVAVGQVPVPSLVTRLPSQLELEVHDFTREEIAEKKFYLLNDNGQIDWFLSSGRGPLDIQYINMLGAHSSYWISPDFVRMVVTEVGRKPVYFAPLLYDLSEPAVVVPAKEYCGPPDHPRSIRTLLPHDLTLEPLPPCQKLHCLENLVVNSQIIITQSSSSKDNIERRVRRITNMALAKKITLYVDTVSPFSYIAYYILRHDPIFSKVERTYVPILLGGVFKKCGNTAPISIKNKDKWVDKERIRWTRLFKVPIYDRLPTDFPPMTVTIMRALCAITLIHPGQAGQGILTKALDSLYQAYWVDNRPTQNKEVLVEVLSETLGQEEAQKVMTAVPNEGKELLIKNTDLALADGAFGLPWFVATNENGDKETFWGVDHLGQVIEFLGLDHPKTGGWKAQL
ncbi:hypothetical protein B7463_g4954, partial [Scytalidium lignicola]